jgi:hypothetical protein
MPGESKPYLDDKSMQAAIWVITFVALCAWSALAWIGYTDFSKLLDPNTFNILSFMQGFFTVAGNMLQVFVIVVWGCGVVALLLLALAASAGASWWQRRQLEKNNLRV